MITGHKHSWDQPVAGDFISCACGEIISGQELDMVMDKLRGPGGTAIRASAVDSIAAEVLRLRATRP